MSGSRSVLLGILSLAAALALGAYWFTASSGSDALEASLSVAKAMGSDTTGYRRATEVRPLRFPADHGPHPGYKTEWWYVTGNLQDASDRSFGYELTIFRFAFSPPNRPLSADSGKTVSSSWRTNQLYMAHFALTDGPEETFHTSERFARGGAGLAGAQAAPFRVWLEDWSMASVGDTTFPVRLRARETDASIDLTIRPEKPMVFQGNQGLSKKGPGAGNASYYYSYTRLATNGTITTGDDTLQVRGRSWMDREWSTSALGSSQEGWDWFALQLEDGRDLMYYQLRNEDGSPSRFSEGTLVAPDGSTQKIGRGDVTLEALDTWTAPDGTHTYPVEWRLRLPAEALDLRIVPLFPGQELSDASVRYWEGAVRVLDPEGDPVGRGYLEMTGYGDSASPGA